MASANEENAAWQFTVLMAVQPLLPDGFCFVADSAQVIGHVILGEGAGIWFGAVLRGDNEPIESGQGPTFRKTVCFIPIWAFRW
jgi:carbonic anhydrase/acetyltransferase-like protein (isoleucine patch superfamily)